MVANTSARRGRRLVLGGLLAASALVSRSVLADEMWVAPTYQTDLGLGIGSNILWPATAIGAVRFVLAVPGDLQSLQSVKVALIPHAPGGAATLNVAVCSAANGEPVAATCAGPFAHPFTGTANQLSEVDISADLAPRLGVAGSTYLAIVAYTTPTAHTDHIVGLRFAYDSAPATTTDMVAFFAGAGCPSGWNEYTTARGRVIVGLPAGGSTEGTRGTSLGSLAARTIVDVPRHSHGIDPPGTTTSQGGSHSHDIDLLAIPGGVGLQAVGQYGSGAGLTASTEFDGSHTHNVNIPSFDSDPTGSASVDVTMPYVQLIACRKS